jgi:hypothetical protein
MLFILLLVSYASGSSAVFQYQNNSTQNLLDYSLIQFVPNGSSHNKTHASYSIQDCPIAD